LGDSDATAPKNICRDRGRLLVNSSRDSGLTMASA
jgi:hypothetical protein